MKPILEVLENINIQISYEFTTYPPLKLVREYENSEDKYLNLNSSRKALAKTIQEDETELLCIDCYNRIPAVALKYQRAKVLMLLKQREVDEYNEAIKPKRKFFEELDENDPDWEDLCNEMEQIEDGVVAIEIQVETFARDMRKTLREIVKPLLVTFHAVVDLIDAQDRVLSSGTSISCFLEEKEALGEGEIEEHERVKAALNEALEENKDAIAASAELLATHDKAFDHNLGMESLILTT